MRQSVNTYIPGFTGLRGVAAFGVFLVHYNQIVLLDPVWGPFDLYELLANGEYGVALFFSLSGFLLSLPYWQSKRYETPLPSTINYACKRIVRVTPAYFFAVTVLLIFYNHWAIPGAWSDILLHYSFLFNLVEFSIFSLNPSFWTLAVEMHFYCLLPVFFYLAHRSSIYISLATLAITAALSYLVHCVLINAVTQVVLWPLDERLTWVRVNGAVLNYSLLAHLPHFAIGAFTAFFFLQLNESRKKRPLLVQNGSEVFFWAVSCLLLILLAAPDFLFALQIPHGRYGLPLIALLMGGLLLALPFTTYAVRLFEWGPIKMFGVLSYGFYLFHHPILQWTDRGMAEVHLNAPDYPLIFVLVSFCLATLAAFFTYICIERPVLVLWKKKKRL